MCLHRCNKVACVCWILFLLAMKAHCGCHKHAAAASHLQPPRRVRPAAVVADAHGTQLPHGRNHLKLVDGT